MTQKCTEILVKPLEIGWLGLINLKGLISKIRAGAVSNSLLVRGDPCEVTG